MKLEDEEMRVGFAMSGGADEQQTSLINNILPGEGGRSEREVGGGASGGERERGRKRRVVSARRTRGGLSRDGITATTKRRNLTGRAPLRVAIDSPSVVQLFDSMLPEFGPRESSWSPFLLAPLVSKRVAFGGRLPALPL